MTALAKVNLQELVETTQTGVCSTPPSSSAHPDQLCSRYEMQPQASVVSMMGQRSGVCNAIHIWPVLEFTCDAKTLTYDTRSGVMSVTSPHYEGRSTQAPRTMTTQGIERDVHAVPGAADVMMPVTGSCSSSSSMWQPSRYQGALYWDAFKVNPGQQVSGCPVCKSHLHTVLSKQYWNLQGSITCILKFLTVFYLSATLTQLTRALACSRYEIINRLQVPFCMQFYVFSVAYVI